MTTFGPSDSIIVVHNQSYSQSRRTLRKIML